ncbi:MAG TPA: SDR family oxidoreductase [Allosphingosinicella sp.]|nr:SDR family oxidoreductase [Allosphingosinicella sp.]
MTDQPAVEQVPAPVFHPDCLAGRSILVTGASSGLGRATAIALSQCGAKVVLTGRDQNKLDQAAAVLGGGDHATVAAEFADADQVAELIKGIAKEHGALDGIFHSAGAYMAMPARMTKQRQIDSMFQASVWGAFGVARAAGQKGVMRDGGALLFMSSVAAQRGHPGTTAYAGAKSTILGMVPVLAIELAPRRIRVNSIVAATIETEMHLNTIANLPDELVQDGLSRHLLGFGRPVDIAHAVIFLMSDAGQWITGTALTVDGGYMAK